MGHDGEVVASLQLPVAQTQYCLMMVRVRYKAC